MMGDKLTGGNTNNNETFSSYHPRYNTLYYITDYGLGNLYFLFRNYESTKKYLE